MKEKLIPDYENGIYSTANQPSGTSIKVDKFSFVYLGGSDPYTENYFVQVSPDNVTWYNVGRRYDDVNGNTQETSFLFPIPAGWYFRCTAENFFYYTIYPLKGENS